jgi:hypothetical protein
MFEFKALFSALVTQQWQGGLPVKVFYIVVQVKHIANEK